MKKSHMIILAFATLVAAIAAFKYLLPQKEVAQEPVQSELAPTPETEVSPEILFPVPATAEDAQTTPQVALPSLDESDAAIQTAMAALAELKRLGETLIFKNLIRNIVVIVDNLPREKLPMKYSPLKPLPGTFQIKHNAANDITLNVNNYPRYAEYVQIATSVDTRTLINLYVHFYPLFQTAYEELGYPKRYFNDRLVAVLDHLLATPEIQGSIRLEQPAVYYKYADPSLEARSAGQKIMIRMGNENAARLKSKFRELRHELTVLGQARVPG